MGRASIEYVAGVDEAGRGPLAGPVVTAAVVLDPAEPIEGLTDSKLLTPKRRQQLAERIRRSAVAWSIGQSDVAEIDSLNILQATLLAMERALSKLPIRPQWALVDGLHSPNAPCAVEAIVRGDLKVPAISAASILAKVYRDSAMEALDRRYPIYGFARHKGYPTPQHLRALGEYGPCPCHRTSFKPVRDAVRLTRGRNPTSWKCR